MLRVPTKAATFALAMSLSAEGSAQPASISGAPTCRPCSIDVLLVTTLGKDPTSPITGGFVPSIARSAGGLYYLVDPADRLVHVFDSTGKQLRTIGRRGGGPGEYLGVRIIAIDGDGKLHLLDPGLGRRTILAPDERVIRSTPLPGGQLLISGIVLPNDGLVTNHVLTGRSDAGFPLQQIDGAGNRVTVFGGEFRFDVQNYTPLSRVLWARDNGELWTGSTFGYRLQLIGSDRRTVKRDFVREAEWFVPLGDGERPASGLQGRRPTNELVGMWEDTSGLLWTVTTMPSPDWKARGDKSRRFERYNTMIEVIDPSKGTLLASHQVDAMAVHALGNGLFMAARELADDTPVVDIWRVQLRRR